MWSSTIAPCVLFFWSLAVQGAAQVRKDRQTPIGNGPRLLSFSDTVPKPHPRIVPNLQEIQWLDADGFEDGWHAKIFNGSDLVIEHIATKEQRLLIEKSLIPKGASGFAFNSDASQVLWATDRVKGWRFSFAANYYIQDIKTKQVQPLLKRQNSDVQLALWNPSLPGSLAFVYKNDIHLWDNGKITQATNNGSSIIFNGVADWTYEEEVMGASRALWFSPDGEYLSYLSFDDTHVPVHTVPLFLRKEQKTISVYPAGIDLRYPKPGYANPVVSASVLRVRDPTQQRKIPLDKAFAQDDVIIGEVAWLTNKHDSLVLRCFNRIQNHDRHILYDVASDSTKMIRERFAEDGWIENSRAIKFIGSLPATGGKDDQYYVDLSDESGWNHIYLHNVQGGKSRQLTSGEWEVSSMRAVNVKNSTIYFTAHERHPTELHLYEVSMIHRQVNRLVDSAPAYWTASFSPNATYYLLNYEGPQVPYQDLHTTIPAHQKLYTLNDNEESFQALRAFQLPNILYLDLAHPSGYNLSAQLTFPPNFDPQKKYPVLLTPYGGPNSQEVKKKFNAPSPASFVSVNHELGYVTFTVDNRGTASRGRAFRNAIYRNTGVVEPADQLWAAQWLKRTYPSWVDTDRIGIWGWSNGGYLAAKCIELDTQGILSFAIATAPATDFRLYDSIYTERYLGPLSEENIDTYVRAAVRNVTNFKRVAGGVLIQHGTADDNVHFAHSATLVERLMAAGMSPTKLRTQFFPDSDHNISFENQSVFLFTQLAVFLLEQKNRVVRSAAAPKRYSWDAYDYQSRAEERVEYKAMEVSRNVLADTDEPERLTLGGSFYG